MLVLKKKTQRETQGFAILKVRSSEQAKRGFGLGNGLDQNFSEIQIQGFCNKDTSLQENDPRISQNYE